jgi:hypothetical protein
MNSVTHYRLFISLFLIGLCCATASGQVVIPPQSSNQLTVSAAVNVTYNSATGLYTYSYSFTNSASSPQEASFIALDFSGDAAQSVQNPQSPQGWQFLKHDEPMVSWTATDIGTVPANFVDDGSLLPSPYQIRPGQTLTGFSFQSLRAPTAIKFYAQGFTQIPQAVDAGDLDAAGYVLKDFTDDSIIGITQGPAPSNPSVQPSGLGFFNFVNLINEAVVKAPISVGVHFNASAGTIDTTTFHASLNGQDITSAFTPTGNGSDLAATLNESASSTIVNGRNVLEGSVSGILPGSTSSQFDLNYLGFYVGTTRPLDLNGDGLINCADLAIVKASFGKKTGQPGFDPRADVNGDGIVNVLDLSAVAKQVPAGTTCP